MDAESESLGPTSRKAAYMDYTEQYKKRLDLCRRAGIQVALTFGTTKQETAKLLSEAKRLWSEPVAAFDAAEARVREQGPASVVRSIDRASTELAGYRALVCEAISADDESREARVGAARSAYEPVYRAYLEFLYAATDVVGDDHVLRLGF